MMDKRIVPVFDGKVKEESVKISVLQAGPEEGLTKKVEKTIIPFRQVHIALSRAVEGTAR